MQTTITDRGQISIPADVRKKLNLKPGMGMEWIVTNRGIYLYPTPENPIESFRGSLKSYETSPKLFDDLLMERKKERDKSREHKK